MDEKQRKHEWYLKKKAKVNNKCEDCGKSKGLHGTRCQSCEAKIRVMSFPLPDRKGAKDKFYGNQYKKL